jgi:ribosome recycling factor
MDRDLEKKLQETQEWLQGEFAGIRTGQASPSLLDRIKVESYGSQVPLNQVGTVGIEDARTLRISVWDASQISSVEQALTEADLGVSVATDSSGVRVIFPELTSDRREQLLKLAKAKLEDARIAVRSVRDDEMKQIEKAGKDGDMSEDEVFTAKEQVQSVVEASNKSLEELFTQKEAELKQ